MKRRAFIAVMVVALAAGCAGSGPSREEYGQSVRETRDAVDEALAYIVRANSRENMLDRMEEASVRIERAADELADDGAAKGFEQATEQIEEALHGLASDLEDTAAQIRDPEFADLLKTSRGVNFDTWDDANAALAKIRRKGIDVRPIDRH